MIPYSRDYRRARRFGTGLPPRRRSGWRRAFDPKNNLGSVAITGLLLLACLQLFPDAVVAAFQTVQSRDCRIVSVVDRDTVRTWCPAKGVETARLMGFDTPEVFSPLCFREFARGLRATWKLRLLLIGASDVSFVKQGTDRYGRKLARLWVDGRNASDLMTDSGHARPYSGGRRAGWCG